MINVSVPFALSRNVRWTETLINAGLLGRELRSARRTGGGLVRQAQAQAPARFEVQCASVTRHRPWFAGFAEPEVNPQGRRRAGAS